MRTDQEIISLWKQRQQGMGELLSEMRAMRDAFNGDVVVPLPEMDRSEQVAVANLMVQGLDQFSDRAGSTMPDVYYPPTMPGDKGSEAVARKRRLATLGWWDMNKLDRKLPRRARQIFGYSSSPVKIVPDFTRKIPRWQLRDPLGTFPAVTDDPDEMHPPDCIFSYRRQYGWLKRNYPGAASVLFVGQTRQEPNVPDSTLIDVLEYCDDKETVLLAVGHARDGEAFGGWGPPNDSFVSQTRLMQMENKIGICPVVTAGRITIDRPQGMFSQIRGIYEMKAKLMSLAYIANIRGVFPTPYLVSRPQEQADFIAGPFDGRDGRVNIVKGGAMEWQKIDPTLASGVMLDRLEHEVRTGGSISPDLGGESGSNIRTGRRGDSVLSSAIDFPIQQVQNSLARSLEDEDRIAVATQKTYFGRVQRTYSINWNGKNNGNVTYTADDIFDSDDNHVKYSHAGADVNSLITGLGQRVSIKMMSTRTAMEIDPLIEDPEREHDFIIAEALEQAELGALIAQAQQGSIPIGDMSRISQLVRSNRKELYEAVLQVQKEAQKRQSPNVNPVEPGSPEAQPGLAQPGQGAEAGQATIQEPPNLAGLNNLLAGLTRPQSAREQGPVSQGEAALAGSGV